MQNKVRVKPGKSASLLGMVMGIVFIFIGFFVVIPKLGAFGIFWTIAAAAIAVIQGYNFFSQKGVAAWEVDIESSDSLNIGKSTAPREPDFETRLRKLNTLKEEGLISQEEFQTKRKDIMEDKW